MFTCVRSRLQTWALYVTLVPCCCHGRLVICLSSDYASLPPGLRHYVSVCLIRLLMSLFLPLLSRRTSHLQLQAKIHVNDGEVSLRRDVYSPAKKAQDSVHKKIYANTCPINVSYSPRLVPLVSSFRLFRLTPPNSVPYVELMSFLPVSHYGDTQNMPTKTPKLSHLSLYKCRNRNVLA